jgi:hypothetical protein
MPEWMRIAPTVKAEAVRMWCGLEPVTIASGLWREKQRRALVKTPSQIANRVSHIHLMEILL